MTGDRDPDLDVRPPLRRWMQVVAAAAFVATASGGVALGAHLASARTSPAVLALDQPTPGPASPSPSPSPTPEPSPEASESSTLEPSPAPAPTARATPVPSPPPPVTSVSGPGPCAPTVYAEVDRAQSGEVDILTTLEGVCPTNTLTTSVTLLTDAGEPVTATGNPVSSTFRCPSSCMPITPGQGGGAVHTGIQPYVWSNWCGAPGIFRVTVRMSQNGVPASTTVVIVGAPPCTAPGQPSRLVAPPG